MKTPGSRTILGGLLALGLALGFAHGATAATDLRLSGADRYGTAVSISQELVPTPGTGVELVYVASGQDFPDALAAGAIAGRRGAPVLLVKKDGLPPVVQAELLRLKPRDIVVLGGEGAVSYKVEDDLAPFASRGVSRVAGLDRFQTAAKLSNLEFGRGVDVVYVASGQNYPDALAGAAAAGARGGPVLLTRSDSLPDATRVELLRLQPKKIVVLGGEVAIKPAVEALIRVFGPTTRISGTDRFLTSVEISKDAFGGISAQQGIQALSTVYIASGRAFPDALAGAPIAAFDNAPILLVEKDAVKDEVLEEICRLKATEVIVLGGTSAVSDATKEKIANHVCPGEETTSPPPTGDPTATPSPTPSQSPAATS